jgi:hypothetical protein
VIRGLALAIAVIAPGAVLAEPTQWWINPGVYAFHFDRDKDLRHDNVGFGVEMVPARAHALMAGSYINSNRARSRYFAYAWRPLQGQLSGWEVSAGVVAGTFDGYPNYRGGGWFVAPLPLIAVEGRWIGANVSIIPTISGRLDGALAFQLKLRIR